LRLDRNVEPEWNHDEIISHHEQIIRGMPRGSHRLAGRLRSAIDNPAVQEHGRGRIPELQRRHFQVAADHISHIEDPQTRERVAGNWKSLFNRTNGRFNHRRFDAWARTGEYNQEQPGFGARHDGSFRRAYRDPGQTRPPRRPRPKKPKKMWWKFRKNQGEFEV